MYTSRTARREVKERLAKDSRCCSVCPPRRTVKPAGSGSRRNFASSSSEIEPRSRPTALALMRISRCAYLRSISTGPVDWTMLATVESNTGRSFTVTNRRARSSGVWRYGSSSWTTRLYWLPVRGSVKIDGLTLAFEFSEKSAALAMSRCESPGGSLLTVDEQLELGVVGVATDVDVGDALGGLHQAGDLAGERVGGREVVAEDLDLDRRLRPEVDDARDEAARDELVARARELAGEPRPERIHDLAVAPRPLVRGREVDLDRRAVGAGVTGEDRRAPLGDADVRDDRRQLLGAQRRPDDRLHALDDALGLLDPRADRRLRVDAELRLVRRGEELGADERLETEPRREDEEHAPRKRHGDPAHDEAATAERPLEEALVERLHAVEEALREPEDAVLDAPGGGVDRVLRPQHPERHERRHRPRHEERGEERDRDRERERNEEELDLPFEEHRRHEDDDRRDRRGEDWHGHLARGVEDGLAARRVRDVQVAVDVLELDDRVVDEPAHGQREPPEGEHVERLAEEIHAD